MQITTPQLHSIYTIIIIVIMYALTWTIALLHTIYYWASIKIKQKTEDYKLKVNEMPMVTVIIPERNEPINLILRLIKALLKQTYPKDKMEVIIVSDDSEDKYVEIKEKTMELALKEGLMIKIYRRDKPIGFKSGALNYALKRSHGKYIITFDVDAIPKEDFIEKAITYMEYKELDALATRWSTLNVNDTPITEAQAISMEFLIPILLKGKAILNKPIIMPGCGYIIRRNTLIEIGGWSENMLADDLDISIKLITSGRKIGYLEDAEVKVEVTASYKDFKNQQSRWIYVSLQTLMKYINKILKANIPLTWKIDLILHLLQYQAILANLMLPILALTSILFKVDVLLHAITLIPVMMTFLSMEALSYIHTARKFGLSITKSIIIMGRCTALTAALAPQTLIQNIKLLMKYSEGWKVTPKGEYMKKISDGKTTFIEKTLTIIGLITMIILLILGYNASAICILTLTLPYAYVSLKTSSGSW